VKIADVLCAVFISDGHKTLKLEVLGLETVRDRESETLKYTL